MIILCRACDEKNGQQILELIKKSKNFLGQTTISSQNEEIKDLKERLFAKSSELSLLYKKIGELLDEKTSEMDSSYNCEHCCAMHRS